MSDLNLEPYPRNVNLFLQCIDKMIDDYENADTWTQKQRDVLNKYIRCLYSRNYIDFTLMIFEAIRQIESNPEVRDFMFKKFDLGHEQCAAAIFMESGCGFLKRILNIAAYL